MVFEDLQWADPGLVDFVESILEWSRNHPIMVVTVARPELMDRRPGWGAGQRNFISLHLEPFSAEAMRDLLDGFVQGLPETVASSVLERAEGVPLYAVETVRMLVDRGVLVQREGFYDVVGELGTLEIPETLQALIASRLDALPAEQRSILQDAAVLGNTLLGRSARRHPRRGKGRARGTAAGPCPKGVPLSEADPRSPERGQFGFVQGLIAEVAVSTISRRDRSAKHLAVARHLESLEDEELSGLVAAHYLEAHQAAPEGPEADVIAVGARDWLSRAGQRALSLGSPEQALAFFEQALQVTPASGERAALLELAGEAAAGSNDTARALLRLEEAIGLLPGDRCDLSAVGRVTAKLAPISEPGPALLRRDRARRACLRGDRGGAGTERVRAALARELAAMYSARVSRRRALEWAETALVLAEQLDDPGLLAGAIGAKAGALFNLGRHREAVILARGQVALAATAGVLREQANGLLYLSVFILDDDLAGGAVGVDGVG